jgi:hypothetical protein
MALSVAIDKARRQTATRQNRDAHDRAALRLEEVFKVAGIADELDRLDRPRSIVTETAFAVAYQCVDAEDEREAVLDAFMKYQAEERAERRDRHAEVNAASGQMVRNNPVWIEGHRVPSEWINGAAAPLDSGDAA